MGKSVELEQNENSKGYSLGDRNMTRWIVGASLGLLFFFNACSVPSPGIFAANYGSSQGLSVNLSGSDSSSGNPSDSQSNGETPDAVPVATPADNPVVLPVDANVINVKSFVNPADGKTYGALGDGIHDDTDAIQLAISSFGGRTNRPNTIYFPKGTYLVRDMLLWRRMYFGTTKVINYPIALSYNRFDASRNQWVSSGPLIGGTLYNVGNVPWAEGAWFAYLSLQGESRLNTTIKLMDRAQGFSDKASNGLCQNPKAVLFTASQDNHSAFGRYLPDGSGNQAFMNSIRDLTINTGSGNPCAMGIDYQVSNKGMLENLRIISGDGQGLAGVLMTRGAGPGMLRNIAISGFKYGVDVEQLLYGMVLEHIQIQNPFGAGIYTSNFPTTVRDLTVTQDGKGVADSAPPIQNPGGLGFLTLIDSNLSCSASAAGGKVSAIQNGGHVYLRNVATQNCIGAVSNFSSTATLSEGSQVLQAGRVSEYTSDSALSLFPQPNTATATLNLPIQETPYFNDTTLSSSGVLANWTSVGARQAGEVDDTAAIQRAMNSGRSTVYFPSNNKSCYAVSGTINVPQSVRKITGLESCIQPSATVFGNTAAPVAIFQVKDASSYPLIIEKLNTAGSTQGPGAIWVQHSSSRQVAIRDAYFSGTPYKASRGAGNVFIEDVDGTGFQFGFGQNVWARQLNPEGFLAAGLIQNQGAKVWILGLKTENSSVVVNASPDPVTRAPASTEVLGGNLYTTVYNNPPNPAFVNFDSSLSVTIASSAYMKSYTDPQTGIKTSVNPNYTTWVSDTQKGRNATLNVSSLPTRGLGSVLNLYQSRSQ